MNLNVITESWKMVYRRPKLVKTPRWTNQVTGPWMDPSFATDTISSEDETTRDGTAAKVLKSNIVPFWQHIGISKVGYTKGLYCYYFHPETLFSFLTFLNNSFAKKNYCAVCNVMSIDHSF